MEFMSSMIRTGLLGCFLHRFFHGFLNRFIHSLFDSRGKYFLVGDFTLATICSGDLYSTRLVKAGGPFSNPIPLSGSFFSI